MLEGLEEARRLHATEPLDHYGVETPFNFSVILPHRTGRPWNVATFPGGAYIMTSEMLTYRILIDGSCDLVDLAKENLH